MILNNNQKLFRVSCFILIKDRLNYRCGEIYQ